MPVLAASESTSASSCLCSIEANAATSGMAVTNGANIHANADEALIWAALNGHLEIVKFLVTHGANIHAQDDEVFKTAVRYANEPMLMLLNAFLNKEKLVLAALGVMPLVAASGSMPLVAALGVMPQKLDNSINAKTNNYTITKSKRSKI